MQRWFEQMILHIIKTNNSYNTNLYFQKHNVQKNCKQLNLLKSDLYKVQSFLMQYRYQPYPVLPDHDFPARYYGFARR